VSSARVATAAWCLLSLALLCACGTRVLPAESGTPTSAPSDGEVTEVPQPTPLPQGSTGEWVDVDWGTTPANWGGDAVTARFRLDNVEYLDSEARSETLSYDRLVVSGRLENTGDVTISSLYLCIVDDFGEQVGTEDLLLPGSPEGDFNSELMLRPGKGSAVWCTLDAPAGSDASELSLRFIAFAQYGDASVYDEPTEPYVDDPLVDLWTGPLPSSSF